MKPAASPLANEAHAELGTVTDPDGEATSWAALRFLDAMLSPLQLVEDLARDDNQGRPGQTALLDIDRCPPVALRWRGQLSGVRVTPGDVTDPAWAARARAEIRNAAGLKRGTPAAIVGAVQATLTGMRVVRLIERDSSPYHFTVIVRTSECPDPAVSEAAARAQKPAGLVMTFTVAESPLVDESTRTIDALTGTIDGATVVNWT